MIISAAGNLEHARVRELVEAAFGKLASTGAPLSADPPRVIPQVTIRTKELEQSHSVPWHQQLSPKS